MARTITLGIEQLENILNRELVDALNKHDGTWNETNQQANELADRLMSVILNERISDG